MTLSHITSFAEITLWYFNFVEIANDKKRGTDEI